MVLFCFAAFLFWGAFFFFFGVSIQVLFVVYKHFMFGAGWVPSLEKMPFPKKEGRIWKSDRKRMYI